MVAIKLNELPTQDKIIMMEQLWSDLTKTPESYTSPTWHAQELSSREQRLQEGKSNFVSFDKVKDSLRQYSK